MSVCTFGVKEYGNLLRCVVSNGGRWAPKAEDLAVELSRISAANVACFNARYSEHMPRAEPSEILVAFKACPRGDMGKAVQMCCLLEYNCVDSTDGFDLVPGSRAALCYFLRKMMELCAIEARIIGD